jgi:hypothetical protein
MSIQNKYLLVGALLLVSASSIENCKAQGRPVKEVVPSITTTKGIPTKQASATVQSTSGEMSDVQQAINNAPAGGVVEIPNGTYNWTGTLTINKAVTLRGQSKGGVKLVSHGATVNIMEVTDPPSGNVEIADLDCDFATAPNHYVFMIHTNPSNPRGTGRILLHDCTFKTNYAYAIEWGTNGGVIWNCIFDGTNSGGLTGISFVANALGADWTRLETLGTHDTDGLSNTYVEDCQFIKTIIGKAQCLRQFTNRQSWPGNRSLRMSAMGGLR